MPELDEQLHQLAAVVEWPSSPAFDLRRRRRRWPVVVALAAALAMALAFAVPGSRGALLRFFHLGGERVERVEVLPRARDVPLVAALGTRIGRVEARRLLGRPFALPTGAVYRAGPTVSALLPGRILFSEANVGGGPEILKKYAAGASEVDFLHVRGAPALWIHGAQHVFLAPTLPARYAGNALVWAADGLTYRLEGRDLTRDRAVFLARSLSR
jgi:hypothetical protein